jgi:uracil-DNA glycosylase
VWREHELRLLRPALVVPVGGLAARELLGETNLTRCIGRHFELGDATAIPLPHPSGASGWLNSTANRELLARAAALVREEIAKLQATA